MFERLLVAVDDSASTPLTVGYATSIARTTGAAIDVVCVNQYLVGGRGTTMLAESHAAGIVETVCRELRAEGITASGNVVRSAYFDVAPAIVKEATRCGSDTIVIGSRRRRGVWRLLGHRVRERLVTLTALPVVTAPAPLDVPSEMGLLDLCGVGDLVPPDPAGEPRADSTPSDR